MRVECGITIRGSNCSLRRDAPMHVHGVPRLRMVSLEVLQYLEELPRTDKAPRAFLHFEKRDLGFSHLLSVAVIRL
jgi:hypothetical protein